MKKILNFILLTLIFSVEANSVNPLSKIEITSNRAVAEKNKNSFDLSYIGNVKVKLADATTADADKLKAEINSNKNEMDKTDSLKKIILDGNVFIQKENLKINSDKAIIYPKTKLCELIGNVKIEQTKSEETFNGKDKNNFPIVTTCSFATLNIVTEKLELKGSKTTPISTILKLESHPGLEKKEKPRPSIHSS